MKLAAIAVTTLLAVVVAAPAEGKDKDKDQVALAPADSSAGTETAPAATPAPKATPTPKSAPTPKPAPTPKGTPAPAAAAEPTDTPANKDKARNTSGDEAETPGDAPALAPAAAPVAGRTIGADVAEGKVTVRVPGSDDYVPLSDAASMPVGAVIDARAGTVVLQAAIKGHGTDTGTFTGGLFEVRQKGGYTELRLRGGDYRKCPRPGVASAAVATKGKSVVRRLWGSDDHGRFRTHGHNSVATVRGTKWLTEDRCDGTLTRVTEGAVEVHVRHSDRTVVVHAGHSFLAPRGH